MNLATLHPLAVERIYPLLQHDRQAVRKRVIQVCFKPMTMSATVYYKSQAIQKLSQSTSSQIQSELLMKVISSIQEEKLSQELQKTMLQVPSSNFLFLLLGILLLSFILYLLKIIYYTIS